MNTLTIILICINIILIAIVICAIISMKRFQHKNTEFMKKLGDGNNIEEMLKKYIVATDYVNQENALIKSNIKNIENDMKNTIQKIGMVRYNAFDDVGSNLSFAVAILNDHNTGIVINGIYARETSSVYAKPVVEGKSEYILSKEEEEAIKIAKDKQKN